MMDSSITYNAEGQAIAFTGDAVEVYKVAVLISSIGLMAKGIKPTRGVSMKSLLALASRVTSKSYKQTQHAKAQADLRLWLDAAKASLPHIQNGKAV